MLRAKYITGLIVSLAMASCGGATEPPPLAEAGLADATLALDAALEIVACSPTEVTWADTTSGTEICKGRYRYDTEVFCHYTNEPECETCDLHKACPIETEGLTATYAFEDVFRTCSYDPILGRSICQPNPSAAETWCAQQKAAKISYHAGLGHKNVTGLHTLTLKSVSTQTYRCEVTVTYKGPMVKRDPSCGCETYSSCDLACDLQPHYSEHGLTRAQVLSLPGAIDPNDYSPTSSYQNKTPELYCTTGEDIASDTANSFEQKFSLAYASLNDPAIVPPTSTDLRDIYIKQLKSIAEFGTISDAQRAQLVELYRDHPTINPDCGSNYAGTAPACDHELDWRYNFCTRLANGHVSGESASHHFDECVSMLIDHVEGRIGDANCNATDQVDTMFDVQREFLKKHAAALGKLSKDSTGNVSGYVNSTEWIPKAASVLGHLNHGWYQRLKAVDQSASPEPLWDQNRLDDELELNLINFWQAAKDAAALDDAIAPYLPSQQDSDGDSSAILTELQTRRMDGFALDQLVAEAAILSTTVPFTHVGKNDTQIPFEDPDGYGESGELVSSITISGGNPIKRLTLSLGLSGVTPNGVHLMLRSPSGTEVEFSWGGGMVILHDFDGQSLAGTWTLHAYNEDSAEGSLNGWTLIAHTEEARHALTAEPLLAVMGQAITPTLERVGNLRLPHDFACAFKKCGPTQLTTRLSDLTGMLAALDDQATLATLTGNSSFSHAGWKETLGTIAQSTDIQDALSSVATSHGLAYPDDLRGPIGNWPALTQRFVSTLNTAKDYNTSYAETGFFVPPAGKTLRTRIHKSYRDAVIDHIAGRKAVLQTRNNDYQGNAASIVHSMIQLQGETSNVTALQDRLNELSLEYDDLTSRKDAHIQALSSRVDEAELVRAIEEANGASQGTTYFIKRQLTNGNGGTELFLSAADAKYDGGAVTIDTIAAIAAVPSIQVNKNEILSLHVSGAWAPQCALSEESFLVPSGTGQALPASPSPVGPEGYFMSWSGETWDAIENSSSASTSDTIGYQVRVCANGPLATGLSVEACLSASTSYAETDTSTSSNGAQSKMSASFASGIRLDDTPFPTAPAGSLLAVEVIRNTATIRDIHLVRSGNTSIQVAGDSDIYLVVNDKDCTNDDTSNKLTVSGSVLESFDNVSKNLVGRMRYVLNEVAAHKQQLVAAREILPSEISAIRSQALGELSTTQVGCDETETEMECFPPVAFSSYPTELQNMFVAFLDKEIVGLERAVRIANIEHEQKRILREMEITRKEMSFAQDRQALVNLLPAWHARNAQQDYLRLQMRQLVDDTNAFFLPVLELWSPNVIQNIRNDANGNGLNQLLAADLEYSMDHAVGDVIKVIESALGDSALNLVGGQVVNERIVVSLNSQPTCTGFGCDVSKYKNVDRTRSNPIWNQLLTGTAAQFTLAPEDIYQDGYTTNQLACSTTLPVLIDMALVLDVEAVGPDDGDKINGTFFGREQSFATQAGMVEYTLLDDTARSVPITVLSVTEEDDVVDVFDAYRQRVINQNPGEEAPAIGLSPFTTIHFPQTSPPGADWGVESANGLWLVMLVERREAVNMSWIGTCQ